MPLYERWQDVPAEQWPWEHFTPYEMRCRGSGAILIDPDFMNWLERLRKTLGFPFIVSSGYRSPAYNAQVSTTGTTGPHTTGRAVDIKMYGKRAHDLNRMACSYGVGGVGVQQSGPRETRFIHLDLLGPRIWSY